MNLTPASGNVSGSEPSVFNRWSMQIHRQHRDFWSSAGKDILTWFLFSASLSGVLQLFLNWASLIIHELPCMFGPGTCLTPCWQRLETCLQISSVFTSVAELWKKTQQLSSFFQIIFFLITSFFQSSRTFVTKKLRITNFVSSKIHFITCSFSECFNCLQFSPAHHGIKVWSRMTPLTTQITL